MGDHGAIQIEEKTSAIITPPVVFGNRSIRPPTVSMIPRDGMMGAPAPKSRIGSSIADIELGGRDRGS